MGSVYVRMKVQFRPAVACCLIVATSALSATVPGQDASPSHDHGAMSPSDQPASLLPASTAHSFSALMMNADAVMHRAMADAPRSGDPDHDFASAMIPHHQGAIDMAKVQLLYGKDPVLRRLAQEIIVSQQQEIAVMQRRIDSLHMSSTLTSPKAP